MNNDPLTDREKALITFALKAKIQRLFLEFDSVKKDRDYALSEGYLEDWESMYLYAMIRCIKKGCELFLASDLELISEDLNLYLDFFNEADSDSALVELRYVGTPKEELH